MLDLTREKGPHVDVPPTASMCQVLEFFAGQSPCVVAMEACGGSHFWGREIGKFGHRVRLIPPAYVKPFVKRQKNDAVLRILRSSKRRVPIGAM